MLQSSRPAAVAATYSLGRTSSCRPVQPRWPARLGPPMSSGARRKPWPDIASARTAAPVQRLHRARARSLCVSFVRPGHPGLPAPSASIRQRFHGGLASDTHRMLAPPPSRIDSCLPEILGARLPLMPCPSVHPRRHDPSGLYISMSGAPSVAAFVSPHPLTSSKPTIFFQSFSSEVRFPSSFGQHLAGLETNILSIAVLAVRFTPYY